MARANGTVKWFSKEKGYGFIRRDDGPDVFVHHEGIEGSGFKMLFEGEPVEFDIIEEPKGLKAKNVTRLNPPAEPPSTEQGGRPSSFGRESRQGRSGYPAG